MIDRKRKLSNCGQGEREKLCERLGNFDIENSILSKTICPSRLTGTKIGTFASVYFIFIVWWLAVVIQSSVYGIWLKLLSLKEYVGEIGGWTGWKLLLRRPKSGNSYDKFNHSLNEFVVFANCSYGGSSTVGAATNGKHERMVWAAIRQIEIVFDAVEIISLWCRFDSTGSIETTGNSRCQKVGLFFFLCRRHKQILNISDVRFLVWLRGKWTWTWPFHSHHKHAVLGDYSLLFVDSRKNIYIHHFYYIGYVFMFFFVCVNEPNWVGMKLNCMLFNI